VESRRAVNILPNIGQIKIPKEKFEKYALDFEKDKDKATAFQLALGYNKTNVDLLICEIKTNADKFEAIAKGNDGYGMRYEVIMTLGGANGKKASVLTAWLDDIKAGELRLISAYVDKSEGGDSK
jgi:hypothetical protein